MDKVLWQGLEEATVREQRQESYVLSLVSFHSVQSLSQMMVTPTFRAGLPSSINPA